MSQVYFPAQVVVLFRRIVNVFSGLSISSHYLTTSTKDKVRSGEQEANRGYEDSRWRSPLRRDMFENINSFGGNRPHFQHTRRWSFSRLLSASVETESSSKENSPNAPPAIEPKHEPSDPYPDTEPDSQDTIHQLLSNPALYDPLRVPRHPIVLCHGLYGFDTRGPSSFPSMRMHYWSNVLSILRDQLGVEVIITSVPGTGSIISRAEELHNQLKVKAAGRTVNFMAHSMGGLDCRHLITHCKPEEYVPASLTTISTPHRGSPFMDWCSENLGLGKLATEEKDLLMKASKEELTEKGTTTDGKKTGASFSSLSLSSLPSSFTTLLMSILDSPAYANLTSAYLNNVFNPATPDNPNVKYFSVAGRMPSVNVWHPFWLPKMVLDDVEQKERRRLKEEWERSNGGFDENDERPLWAQPEEWGNDGLVTIQSAKWGEFLGVMQGCDHWELRGARGIEFGVDLPAIPAIGLGPPSSASEGNGLNYNDGWNLKDWGWFLRAWSKEEKIHKEAVKKTSSSSSSSSADRKKERESKREQDDAVIKASTEKLSLVFDWITDRVPTPPLPLLGGKKPEDSEQETKAFENKKQSSELMSKEGRSGKRNDLATRADLERFYVALSRKLYDEGL